MLKSYKLAILNSVFNMITQNIALYDHTAGSIIIGFFGLVCIGFIVMTVLFFRSGKKKK
ncbi:MAG: hypothetical protein Q4A09_00485 [Capnocytophaga felis]|nr:hypothetical protein [Capnocytophaga felis]